MRPDDIDRLAREAATAGFRKVVITGGEPLVHPQRDELLERLNSLRGHVRPAQIVLRTNLTYSLEDGLAEQLVASADQIVISLDGDQGTHDARRGMGTYARTVGNLRRLLFAAPATKLLLTAVLTAEQIDSAAGQAVRKLGKELGVKVRFKSVLPIGRGREMGLTPSYYNSIEESTEALASSIGPMSTCGLGMNLYIDPHGECFPCYALMGENHALGNALEEGLAAVLSRNDDYREVTVDSNTKCRKCNLRYLCGGFCRTWSLNDSPDSAPQDCTALQTRASDILLGALETLEISPEQWHNAGLPMS